MILTVKQEKFCIEYIKTGNKSEAYRQAYNTENMASDTINRKAFELSENGKIKARIEQLQKEVSKRNDVDIDWCIQQLKVIVEENERDRVQALDKLMKYLGGYEKNNDQKQPQNKTINLYIDGKNIVLQ